MCVCVCSNACNACVRVSGTTNVTVYVPMGTLCNFKFESKPTARQRIQIPSGRPNANLPLLLVLLLLLLQQASVAAWA